jgi:hypothetical protein
VSAGTDDVRRRLQQRIASDEAELRAAVDALKTASIQKVVPSPPTEWRPSVQLASAFLVGLWLGFRRARRHRFDTIDLEGLG